MRIRFSEKQAAFQKEVRDFLATELNGEPCFPTGFGLVGDGSIEFSKKMAAKGWIGMTWPKEFGGQERTYVEKMILSEEICRVRAPVGYHFLGDRQVGPALIKFGSDWQKEYFLPRIADAEEEMSFCLLFSEPNAGSDLVAITTSAEKDGDDYILNGQKVWSSSAHDARWGWLLAKTKFDDSVPAHMTCSEFILDMKSPGIEVCPLRQMTGGSHFSEVFLNEVRIPDTHRLGAEGEGWALDTGEWHDYEFDIGTFRGALNPHTTSFREFPEYVRNNLDPARQKKVAMFCTGGIRCEKASAFMLREGFEEVYHLQGGILRYLEEIPEEQSAWEGECFVFDNRVAVDHRLQKGHYDQCHGCRHPITEADKQSGEYLPGICCPVPVFSLAAMKDGIAKR